MEKGVGASLVVTGSFLPTIACLFPVMAFGGIIAAHYQAGVNEMLLGKYGYLGTLTAAFGLPTSNSVVGPIKEYWGTEALQPLLLYFLTVSALVCWPVFIFRSIGLTLEIGTKMYLTNWAVAIGILPVFWLWSRSIVCGGWMKAIASIFGL